MALWERILDLKQNNNPSTTKTPYQQVFSQPVQQEWKVGDKPNNYGQALATINAMYKTNPTGAMEKLNLLNQYRTQPGNKWFDPYSVATNNVVNELKSYGIDPAELNDDWFKTNTSWQGYLRYNGTTTTPSTPTKKSTAQEKAAYALYQFQSSMGTTNAAKNEWAAAQDELGYWANRKDLNLSDDDIISKVFGSGKYSTLKKMDDSRTTGKPLELNEAIDYNPDSVRGVLWAARNGGGTGNSRQDIANYYSKVGNGWTANEDISAKLNKADLSTYSPHEIGMTGKDMDEVGAYFGVDSFAPGEIEAMRSKVDWDDATSVKMWQKAYGFEQDTLEAEKELAEFNRQFERRMNRGFADQNAADKWIEDQLSSGDFKMLAKMDSGIQKGDPMNLTRAVPYRKQMYQNLAAEAIANPKKSGTEIMDSYGMPVSEADRATVKVENETVASAIDAMGSFLSKGEKDYFDAVPGVDYAQITAGLNGIAEGMKSGMIDIVNNAEKKYAKANNEYAGAVLSSIPMAIEYEKYKDAAARLETSIGAFEGANEQRLLANEDIQSQKIVETDDTYVELYMGTDGKYTVNEDTERMIAEGAYEDFRQSNPSITFDECLQKIHEADQKICDEENAHVEAIRKARAETGESGLNTPEEIAQYEKDKETLRTLNDWLKNNYDAYNNALRSVDEMKKKRDAIGDIAAKANGAEYDPSDLDSLISFAGSLYQYEPMEADGYSLVDEITGKSAEDIGAMVNENDKVVADVKFAIEMLGDSIPDDLQKHYDAFLADAERQNRVYNNYLITNDPQFKSLADKGRDEYIDMSDISNVKIGNTQKQWFPLMTPEEMDIYFALAARDGVEAADQFYLDLRDDLMKRLDIGIENITKKTAESGALGRLASEALAILPAGFNALAGLVYSAGVALGADEKEISALKIGSHFSQAQHQANINAVKEVYKDNPVLADILSGAYEIMYNRGNSLVTAMTVGQFMPKVAGDGKIASFLNNILSATPIAISAASDALERAIERNANPTQLAIIFGATLLAESWTEGIEFGHIEEAGKLLLTKDGITTFLKNYIPNALSEVVGESANDLIENAADYWVKYINNPDYQTEHDNAVKKALAEDDTLTPEQAEALVHQAEIDGVLHTAIISFFSPGADVVAMTGNTLTTYTGYALEAREYNQNATGKHAKKKTVRDIRLEHEAAEAAAEAARKAAEEAKKNPKPVAEETVSEPVEPAAQPEQYPVAGPEETQRRSHAQAMDAYDSNIILLEDAIDANATTQAAAIASAIDTGNTYMAQAAAAKLNLGMVEAVMVAGRQMNLNIGTLSTGLQLAALGNGQCAEILNNGVSAGMSATEIATQLATAVASDMQNPGVAQGVAAGIHDARVNEEFKRLMAGLKTTSESTPTNSGEAMERLSAKTAVDAMEAVDNARNETKTAEAVLEIKQNELIAAQQGVSEAAASVANDPVNDGNQMTAALSKMVAASAVVQEYTQKLEKARERQKAIEDKNMKLIEETTAGLRQEAENTVSQQEAEEAEQARVAAEQAQAEAQARAEAERAEQMSRNITTLQTEEFVEKYYPDATDEQKKNVADRIDYMKQQTSAEAILDRAQFVKSLSNKFGTKIRVADTTEGGKKTRSNAYVDVNTGEIVVDHNSTMSDILYAVLPHELMHLAEKSGNYKALADTLLQIKYGKGVTYDSVLQAANGGDRSGAMATAVADLLARKTLYDERLGSTHTNEYALQETVADLMGGLFRSGENGGVNADLVNRLVAEEPSVAKRIMNAIKSFIWKMAGFNDPALTQAQMAVDMLNAALKNRKADGNEVKHSLDTSALVTDDHGNELATELPGGTVALDTEKFSLSTFNAEEQNRVRDALLNAEDENGAKLFTEDEVDKYMTNALGIASMIAADRTRLDFEADKDQVFLKKNQDYYFTLDASTLCAKRLLYQGTFNAIQKMMPNEALMPDDLIDLVNIMREMGYETPCGICYVESRRRWLDKYAQEWLDSFNGIEGEPMPTLADLTTSDGLSEMNVPGSPKYAPQTRQAFIDAMSAKGSANPKVVQLRTEYNGDIRKLSDTDIQKVKDIGGLRIQSFSDFETPHLLDMIQAVYDMASVGLTSQAYTKVPNFAWVFGDTGIKINLSLIGKGTGLDADGNLVFDNVEGMNFEQAMRLRDRYSKNVGTILVGINDEHIIAAMGDPRIDFIIPFHKSGWSHGELSRIPVLNSYKDYTATQNEQYITGENIVQEKGKGQKAVENWIAKYGEKYPNYKVIDEGNGQFTIEYRDGYKSESFTKHKERTGEKLSNFEPVGANQYWNFDESGEWNARKYLQMCAESKRLPKFYQFLVDNGDGSFSLPEGNDKRSRAIREGYWKTLIDFKMYENDGYGRTKEDGTRTEVKGSRQTEVTPNVNMQQAERVMNEHKLGRQMPNRADGTAGPFIPMKSNNDLPTAEPAAEAFAEFLKYKRQRQEKLTRERLARNPKKESDDARNKRIAREGAEIYQAYSARNAFGASANIPLMDQTADTSSEEPVQTQQNRMAIDAETGETVRYSLPSDASYLAAVERGEMDEAQRMVDEAAKEAGYDIKGYHGTARQFNVFDKSRQGSNWGGDSRMGPGFYFAHDRETASRWTDGTRVIDAYLSIKRPLDLRGETPDDIANAIREDSKRKISEYDESYPISLDRYIQNVKRIEEMNLEHPSFFIDGFKYDENGKMTDGIREFLSGLGYDGIISDKEIVVFEPEQIKSADPVTYDDNGNVIPLSERFNDQNEDIRYSLPSPEILDQQIQNFFNQRYSLSKPLEGQKGPSSSTAGTAERQFGGGMLQESEMDDFAKDVVREYGRYFPDTNLEQIKRAVLWVRSNKLTKDSDGLTESMQKVSDNKFDYRSADGQARMVALMAIAVAKNDVAAQTVLADAFNRQGTDLGRALQSRKLFRMMTPAGRIATIDKMLKDEQARLEQKGVKVDLKFSDWVYMAAAAATEEGDFTKVRQMAAEELADQLPANWKDRIRSIRMLSMLANPRTHIRNYIGNLLFVPAVSIKNKLGAVAETLAGVEQGERTKTLRLRVDKDIREFAEWDARQHQDDLTGDSRWKEGDIVRREQKLFKGKFAWLQSLSDFNSGWLEKEDWHFLRNHYTRALGGWMQANGYTVEQVKSHPELLEKGRAYALNEAQKATYRDFNAVANKLNQLSRQGGPVGFIVDAALPFKKTPANILKRGIEYSPIGLAKSLSADLYNWKKGNMTTNQLIDDICSGLTGTGILMMGALLSSLGIVTVGMDDDDDRFETERGGQKYAVNLGKLLGIKIDGQDVTYTMDWAAPMSMPFFVGAAVMHQLQEEKDGYTFEDFLNDSSSIAEPVFNLSMLEGVNSLFETSKNEETNSLTQIGAKILSNYATSYVPSLLGGITRTFDPVRRKSFVKSGESGGPMGTFRYAWEQTENKIPGLSQTNIPYRNSFGEADESSFLEKAFENFISPGYVSVTRNDPVIEELERLYGSSDVSDERKTALVPKLPNKAVSGTALEPEQYDAITVQRGHTAKNLMSELMKTDYYKNASDEDRAIMMADVWTYATQTAQNDTVGRKMDTWVLNSRTNPVQSIINRSKKTIMSETQSGWKAEAVQAVNAGDYDALDVCIEGLKDAGVKDAKSSVKSAISSEYKAQYIMAYQRGDYDELLAIEDTLENTGLFRQSDFEKWLDSMNAQISDEEI